MALRERVYRINPSLEPSQGWLKALHTNRKKESVEREKKNIKKKTGGPKRLESEKDWKKEE